MQAAPAFTTLATQTTWYRPVNKGVQFESDGMMTNNNSSSNTKPATKGTLVERASYY